MAMPIQVIQLNMPFFKNMLSLKPVIWIFQVETEIRSAPTPNSNVDGYMYGFDCKPYYDVPGIDPKYSAIGNEHKVNQR